MRDCNQGRFRAVVVREQIERRCVCAHRCSVTFTSLPELLTTPVEKTGVVFENPETASVSR